MSNKSPRIANLERLNAALAAGLADLTVNEIREVLVQMYAYCGFPRSLTALGTLVSLLSDRSQQGIRDVVGPDASPLRTDKSLRELGTAVQTTIAGRPVTGPVYEFAPVINDFLKDHLFGAIFGRDVLDFQARELATVSALASLPAEAQLKSHLGASLNVGLTPGQLRQFVEVLADTVGSTEANLAAASLATVFTTP